MAAPGDSNVVEVLGEHTLVGEFRRHPAAWAGTIAGHGANAGRLPPYMIVVGDRRRVVATAAMLDDAKILNAVMEGAGLSGGRVHVAVGLYRGTPVAVVEHGMGCASTEIIVREVLSNAASAQSYDVDGAGTFAADARYIVRVGSAAGVNASASPPDEELVRPFDLVVTTHQAGVSGTDLQAVSGLLNYNSPAARDGWKRSLADAGIELRGDDEMAWLPADADVRAALARQGRRVAPDGVRVHELGAYSKDSLYAESSEEEFMRLRSEYGVGCSEMEFCTLERLAELYTKNGSPVKAGMVVFCLGVIPGASFVHDKAREGASSGAAIRTALEALHELSQGHLRKSG